MNGISSTASYLALAFFLPLLTAAGQVVLAQESAASHSASNAEAPGFRIKVELSAKAGKELLARKETIIVAGFLFGYPKKNTPKRFVDEMGQVDLGEMKREIAPGEIAVFEKLKMRPVEFQQIDGDGPQLLINVYSGRRSSNDNLIVCNGYEDALKAIKNSSIDISCKLIGE